MKRAGIPVAAGVAAMAALLIHADTKPAADGPQYTADGRLVIPANYREWVFLSSGLGMAYGPMASPGTPRFDNVFVSPSAYRSFLATGRWPDHTVMVLEVRESQSNGSINRNGHYQTGVVGVEVHVKDEKRFPSKWAFFGFDDGAAPAKLVPTTANCYSCHEEHGAVDTTFVQFYPTLIEVAKQKGTLKTR
jgi:hypothetical protein